MQVSLLDLPNEVLEKIFHMICTDAAAAISFTVACKDMRRIGSEPWARWLDLCKDHLIEIAGGYSLDTVHLSILLFMYMDFLQTDVMHCVQMYAHMHPYIKDLNMFGVVIVSNISRVQKAILHFVRCMSVHEAFAEGPTRATVLFDPTGVLVIATFTMSNIPAKRFAVRNVRLAVNAVDPLSFNRVTLSFYVRSYAAAQRVQGFLLLMGDASNSVLDLPWNTRHAFTGWQDSFRKRAQKPDVQVRLKGVHMWDPVPPAFAETPITSPGAWQTLANSFQKFEVCSATGAKRSMQFIPATPKVFGTLQILCD